MAENTSEKTRVGIIIRLSLVIFLILGGLIYGKYKMDKKVGVDEILGSEAKIDESKEKLTNEIKDSAQKVLNEAIKKSERTMDEVLGQATDIVIDTASKSAEKVKDFVFDNTVGNLLKQIDKLPDEQKEDIKRNICK